MVRTMAEYIDREALEKAMTIAAANGKDKDRRTWEKAICVLHDMPTIEAEPVKHGAWKLVEFQSPSFGIDHVLMCTNCGFVHEYDAWFNRCPNCTARMDGESE